MVGLLTALHVLVALILILFVLLQSARGTDVAGAFGGMGSQAAFGPRGTATFLSKATVGLAVVFMANSLVLAILSNRAAAGAGRSVLSGEESAPVEQAPSQPAPAGVPAGPIGIRVNPPGSIPETPTARTEIAPSAGSEAPSGERPASGSSPSESPSGAPPAAAPASPSP
jgi:preprotein translocase subunit SecG